MSKEREDEMSYLKDFRERIENNDYPGFLKIWEEYCYGDQVDAEELILTLQAIKNSEMSSSFGLQVERILPLWRDITDPQLADEALQLIFDLQTTQSEELADLATTYLQKKHPDDPLFMDKARLIGLRNRTQFQGCIRNYELLTHMKKGNFVFHTAGWGTGEIVDASWVREEITLEFEYVIGHQSLSFEKAFKTLLILPSSHFYARRFGDPDALEAEARNHPGEIIRLLLKDLGPKTAAEIKEELNELVIPSKDWNRWWQTARAKIKKDTKIQSPKELKKPFRLREKEIPHEVELHKALENNPSVNATIQMVYTFLRDFPETLKNKEFKASLQTKLSEIFEKEEINESQKLQLFFFLEDLSVPQSKDSLRTLIQDSPHIADTIRSIEVIGFQKRAMQLVRKNKENWKEIFLDLFFTLESNLLRDFLLVELENQREDLQNKLNHLLIHPLSYPEVFVWYFQKIIDKKSNHPFSDANGKNRFFEGLLILLDHVEKKAPYKDLSKKVHHLITGQRYKIVREIMQQSTLEEVKEYLLLATKCQSLEDHDIKILYSLAEVAHPTLARLRKEKNPSVQEESILWTTQEGYQKTQERIQHIATSETIQNAKEIETARALGDLRENAEFKAALEKRDRLQSELKFLSDQIASARILTPDHVPVDEVGIGSVVDCNDSKGVHIRFTLLGPWDADPEKHILSFQSKLAQAMKGKTVGEQFAFQSERFTITNIGSFFDT